MSARIVRIKNTLELKTMLVSETLLPGVGRRRDLVFTLGASGDDV